MCMRARRGWNNEPYLLAGKTVKDTNNRQVGDSSTIGTLERVGVLDRTLGVEGGEDEGLDIL